MSGVKGGTGGRTHSLKGGRHFSGGGGAAGREILHDRGRGDGHGGGMFLGELERGVELLLELLLLLLLAELVLLLRGTRETEGRHGGRLVVLNGASKACLSTTFQRRTRKSRRRRPPSCPTTPFPHINIHPQRRLRQKLPHYRTKRRKRTRPRRRFHRCPPLHGL